MLISSMIIFSVITCVSGMERFWEWHFPSPWESNAAVQQYCNLETRIRHHSVLNPFPWRQLWKLRSGHYHTFRMPDYGIFLHHRPRLWFATCTWRDKIRPGIFSYSWESILGIARKWCYRSSIDLWCRGFSTALPRICCTRTMSVIFK